MKDDLGNPNDSFVVFLTAGLVATRETQKRTRRQVAKEVGVKTREFTKWEERKKEPTLGELQRWARALGGSITPKISLP